MQISMVVHDTISSALTYKIATTAIQVGEVMASGAAELEQYAKSNAPWEDRSGNARDGLNASVGVDGGEVVISLAHSVDYGVFLELKDDGLYAILVPTIEALGPEILTRAGVVVVTN